jgi:hypothetical protein
MTVLQCVNGYRQNRVTIGAVSSAESDVGKLRAVGESSAERKLPPGDGRRPRPPLQCDSPDTRSCSLSPAGLGRNCVGGAARLSRLSSRTRANFDIVPPPGRYPAAPSPQSWRASSGCPKPFGGDPDVFLGQRGRR